jgi:Cof subfamily protein (haloacid dehalogenase superfamily)
MSQTLNQYKALLFDVDKTLSTSKRDFTPRTQAALKKIAEAGYVIGLCTGRSYASLYKMVMSFFPDSALHITAGGAQVVDKNGKIWWESLLPSTTTHEIADMGSKLNEMFFFPVGKYAYASPRMISAYRNIHPLVPDMVPFESTPTWEVPVIPTVDLSQEFIDFLRSRDDITMKQTISYRGMPSADITSKEVTKARGIVEWSKLTGIRPTEIIGFGDSDNDIEFLEIVGWSVAMGNATPAIQNIVDRTIGDCDHDGIAIYLEKLLEGAPL